jgi:hypothetical protein
MTRQQKRKMERNSKKKQTKNIGVVSITMVDTKSIIDGKNQFFFLDDMNLNKKKKLMQTIVLTNFGDETHINFGLLCIIHEYTNDFDSENFIKSTFEKIINISSDFNNPSILNDVQKITVIDNHTFELTIDSTKSILEIIKNKMFETANELINFNKKVLELEAA